MTSIMLSSLLLQIVDFNLWDVRKSPVTISQSPKGSPGIAFLEILCNCLFFQQTIPLKIKIALHSGRGVISLLMQKSKCKPIDILFTLLS